MLCSNHNRGIDNRGEKMVHPIPRHPEPESRVSAFHAGLIQLAEAHKCSEDVGCNRWEFAIGMECLVAMGLSASVLRWLVSMGYVEHAFEVTTSRDTVRKFRLSRNLSFLNRTCFVLTEAGISFVAALSGAPSAHFSPGAFRRDYLSKPSLPAPLWSNESRSLIVGWVVVKKYRIPSPNQEAILSAFQEEGWPRRIDDPLRPQAEQVSKCRLHDTIKCLNRHHQRRLIRFRGDGTGEGVCWEYLDASVEFQPADAMRKKTGLPVWPAHALCLPEG
jgi:hypothetical protein